MLVNSARNRVYLRCTVLESLDYTKALLCCHSRFLERNMVVQILLVSINGFNLM
jgi:hypothetical protein